MNVKKRLKNSLSFTYMRHLEITTYIGCPNMCSYCPQKLLISQYKGNRRMDIATFDKILANTPNDVDIHFSGFSELFFHKDYMKFLEMAAKEHQVVVYTTTNGLKEEDLPLLKNINFKQFVVHQIEGARNINFPFPVQKISVTNPISRGGSLFDVQERDQSCEKSCQKQPFPEQFSQNVVLPNGDVYLCCMDYGLKHKLGNLLEQNFNDLNREKQYDLCRKCEYYA